MKNELLNDIIRFSMSRETLSDKSVYLLKGLLFASFLKTVSRRAGGDEAVSAASQAGDDIYPLF